MKNEVVWGRGSSIKEFAWLKERYIYMRNEMCMRYPPARWARSRRGQAPARGRQRTARRSRLSAPGLRPQPGFSMFQPILRIFILEPFFELHFSALSAPIFKKNTTFDYYSDIFSKLESGKFTEPLLLKRMARATRIVQYITLYNPFFLRFL